MYSDSSATDYAARYDASYEFKNESDEDGDEEGEGDGNEEKGKDKREEKEAKGGKKTEEKPKEPSLSRLRTRIEQSLSSNPQEFMFACGGSILVAASEDSPADSPSPNTVSGVPLSDLSLAPSTEPSAGVAGKPQDVQTRPSPPITIRWDPESPSTPASQCKLSLPLEDGQQENLTRLLSAMQPAKFGLGGENVYDESYRKATNLDPSRFVTTFNPYELGIVDIVAQLLLPNLQGTSSDKGKKPKRGVRAELYKMNAYSGPSGHFRAHVDTPRSVDQFGSLVVCLPVTHTGGQLKVEHLGKEVTFNWGTGEDGVGKAPAIQWAAFYGDCKHEVLEVTSGHRLTLTYNLYATYGGGAITGLSNAIDVTRLSLYGTLDSLLKHSKFRKFLRKGGSFGILTKFAYPHTHKDACLPYSLKGVDMAVWEILSSLGCSVELRPLANRRSGLDRAFIGTALGEHVAHDSEVESDGRLLRKWSKRGNGGLRGKEVLWLSNMQDTYMDRRRQVRHELPQISYIAYGNESSLGVSYSECAIIATVPA